MMKVDTVITKLQQLIEENCLLAIDRMMTKELMKPFVVEYFVGPVCYSHAVCANDEYDALVASTWYFFDSIGTEDQGIIELNGKEFDFCRVEPLPDLVFDMIQKHLGALYVDEEVRKTAYEWAGQDALSLRSCIDHDKEMNGVVFIPAKEKVDA